jgi:hypothetical protein
MMQFTQRARTIALRTAKHAALAGVLLASAVTAMAQTDSPIGTWQTIDDSTGQPKALVQIAQDSSGSLSGKVIKGLGANDQPDRRCTECTDARKDQRYEKGGRRLGPRANSRPGKRQALQVQDAPGR